MADDSLHQSCTKPLAEAAKDLVREAGAFRAFAWHVLRSDAGHSEAEARQADEKLSNAEIAVLAALPDIVHQVGTQPVRDALDAACGKVLALLIGEGHPAYGYENEDAYNRAINDAASALQTVMREHGSRHQVNREDPKPLFRHVKTGGLYRLLWCNLRLEWAPNSSPCVLYQSEKDAQLWVRPESEFFDGRFIEADEDDSQSVACTKEQES